MNIVDIIILGILGLSVLIGLYRGFVASLASMGGGLVSMGVSFWLGPKLADMVRANPELLRTLMTYTDASSRIGDLNLSMTSVTSLTETTIAEILDRVALPGPLSTLLKTNLENQVFAPSGLTMVGDYVTQTILGAILNVICFIICFLAIFIAFHLILNFLKAVFRFPVLKQMNSLAGGVFGLLRGALLCFVAFAVLPLVETIVPIEGIAEIVSESTLAPLFNGGNLILAIMNGKL